MNLEQFKNWAISQGSVGKFTDGNYVGECVSLINQYLGRVFGIRAGSWGNAKDWATNGEVTKYFDKVSSPQAGDIGVSGATPTNPYGHIWIYLSPSLILEQNGKVSRRVSTSAPYFKPIAILRRKGGAMSDFSKEANERQEALQAIAKEVSVDYKNFNDVQQVITNIRSLYKLINDKDALINSLNKNTGEFEEVGNNTGLFQRKKK